jgi:tRNA 2-thiocytidine biosynthesis protein TtcA
MKLPIPRRLLRQVGQVISRHDLIADGDRVLVAMSGGKDSYGLLVLLRDLQRRAPVDFDLVAVHLDQGHPGYDGTPLESWLKSEGVAHRILREDTYSIVIDKIPEGKTYCSLCSRLRRGVLYRVADELGCNKIALGHHRDDALETLLLNLFFAGKLGAMPARLVSDDGRHVVIRPLITCAESDLVALAEAQQFPILPCKLCGSQSEAQRKQMKALIASLEAKHPTVRASMLAALSNVVPSHLLDPRLAKRPDIVPRTGRDVGPEAVLKGQVPDEFNSFPDPTADVEREHLIALSAPRVRPVSGPTPASPRRRTS